MQCVLLLNIHLFLALKLIFIARIANEFSSVFVQVCDIHYVVED